MNEGQVRQALDRLRGVVTRFFPPGEAGEAQAKQAFDDGQAEALLIWSSQLRSLDPDDTLVIRGPWPARGTFLVVNQNAPWRERQAAFRLARWLTEPIQTAQLADQLWTIPVRHSAAQGAIYGGARGSTAWRRAAVGEGHRAPLPAREALWDALVTQTVPALVTGDTNHATRVARRISELWQVPPSEGTESTGQGGR
jgi:hypothetical protein